MKEVGDAVFRVECAICLTNSVGVHVFEAGSAAVSLLSSKEFLLMHQSASKLWELKRKILKSVPGLAKPLLSPNILKMKTRSAHQ